MTTVGRKRNFDKGEALDKAMRLFWDNGYEGTSLSNLTSALGINKPSLYAAFGNKEQLFSEAISHYIDHYGAPLMQHLKEPAELPLAQRLENYLFAVIEFNCTEGSPKGCFLVNSCCVSGATSSSDQNEPAKQDYGLAAEEALGSIFLAAQQNGQLPKKQNAKEIAAYVLSLMYGLSVMARRGKTREELHAIARTALNTMRLNP